MRGLLRHGTPWTWKQENTVWESCLKYKLYYRNTCQMNRWLIRIGERGPSSARFRIKNCSAPLRCISGLGDLPIIKTNLLHRLRCPLFFRDYAINLRQIFSKKKWKDQKNVRRECNSKISQMLKQYHTTVIFFVRCRGSTSLHRPDAEWGWSWRNNIWPLTLICYNRTSLLRCEWEKCQWRLGVWYKKFMWGKCPCSPALRYFLSIRVQQFDHGSASSC